MKLPMALCLILLLNLLTYTLAYSSNCHPQKGSKLLHTEYVYRQAYTGVAQDVYVAYPKGNESTNSSIQIVDFCIHDHDPNLYGAKPVFAYDVNYYSNRRINKATIILRGQESRGIKSTVQFYGV